MKKGNVMKKLIVGMLSAFMALSTAMTPVSASNDVEKKVTSLMSIMTLEQKVGQMLQPDTRSITPEQVKEYFIGSILSGGGQVPQLEILQRIGQID